MLSFEKADLRKNLCNFLTVFQRLEYQQRYRPKIKNDILKERTGFNRDMDYAKLHDHSIANISKYETTNTSFYLTKDDFLREHHKSDFATVVRKPLKKERLSEVPMFNKKAMLVVDCMA